MIIRIKRFYDLLKIFNKQFILSNSENQINNKKSSNHANQK